MRLDGYESRAVEALVLFARRFSRRPQLIWLYLADGTSFAAGVVVATMIRLDFELQFLDVGSTAALAVLAVLIGLAFGTAAGLYNRSRRLASFDEVVALAGSAFLVTTLLTLIDLFPRPRPIPLGAAISSGPLTLVAMTGHRAIYRHLFETTRRPVGGVRVLVFGAGEGGYQAVHAMLADSRSKYIPVGLIDDDPGKRHRRFMGIPVVGTRHTLRAAADTLEARIVLIAIPSAPASLIAELVSFVTAADLTPMVLPAVSDLMGAIAVSDIREVTEEDFLGRRNVRVEVRADADYLTGKRVLVTGAGGSIGAELCRQLSAFSLGELIMVDRDESALHAMQLSITRRALLDTPDIVLLDIRDRDGVDRLFAQRRPDVVFHAAALKHLPILERHPLEAVKTNIWGTLAVVNSAARSGVERLINISTDKAADPASVLGYSKRIGERLVSGFATDLQVPYSSVRFGNVLGSRGSVLDTFRSQVACGGPLTVTHPDVTRFFMTIGEAVELVIQAGAIGAPGEVMVLDMGEPVKILTVARLLASRSPEPIEVLYTGLRPGEKLHESLFGAGEIGHRRLHPLITHVEVPPLEPSLVQCFTASDSPEFVIDLMRSLCTAFGTDEVLASAS